MEDRYEIRGKIGQGGLGAVYRGFDTRMSREVAIKRISAATGDPELLQESTRQLIKEAGALASLQHPHIVTVYDVGSDEDGPYVVMELISGKTLDELIERAPLTWADFRELAMQTQEALIAAQELNLIHSDLKPSNLMLTWLPSGKFQVKIVDFGLATLSQSQTKQELESLDAVFGSVFFMPPEQFERTPLDARSDIYSMGCVYYQALTGNYPFDGTTGNEVMDAHLRHSVKPLNEVRAGIPVWACDWIMWQINRYAQDRPESSREALSVFLKNDRMPNSIMSTGVPKPVVGPPRPRLVIPGSRPAAPAAVAVAAPAGPATQALAKAKVAHTSNLTTENNEGAPITQSAPQPLAPPEGFKPSVHTSRQESQAADAGTSPTPTAAGRRATAGGPARPASRPAHAAASSPPITQKVKIALGVAGTVVLGSLSLAVFKLNELRQEKQFITDTLEHVQKSEPARIPVNSTQLRMLLESMTGKVAASAFPSVGRALILADATDGTDLDSRIADFATQRHDLPLAAKEVLIGQVLPARNNPVILPAMIQLASQSNQPALVVSALQAVRGMAGDDQFPAILKLLESTSSNEVRVAAELNIEEILRKSRNVPLLSQQLKTSQESSIQPDTVRALQRLQSVARSMPAAG